MKKIIEENIKFEKEPRINEVLRKICQFACPPRFMAGEHKRSNEDLAAEAGFSAGETASAGAGVLGIIGGAILGLLGFISGIGAIIMMAIGLLALLGAGGHCAETLNKAAENLKRANDDLEKCLKSQ